MTIDETRVFLRRERRADGSSVVSGFVGGADTSFSERALSNLADALGALLAGEEEVDLCEGDDLPRSLGVRRTTLPFGNFTEEIPSGHSVRLVAAPALPFRGHRLVVHPSVARFFDLEAVSVGHRYQTVNLPPLPLRCDLLALSAMDTETVPAGGTLSLLVKNIDAEPRAFYALYFGIAADENATMAPRGRTPLDELVESILGLDLHEQELLTERLHRARRHARGEPITVLSPAHGIPTVPRRRHVVSRTVK